MKGKLQPDNSCLQFMLRVPDSATETFSTLNNCSSTISSGCTVLEGTVSQTSLDNCSDKFAAVKTKSKECYSLLTDSDSPVMFPKLSHG